MNFSEKIIDWYLKNKRELPWRETKDPYAIWLSEIILQQTRVVQGLDYYCRFLEAFPTIFDLAKATEEEVLKLWQGLGYYSRARNMHAAAREIVTTYGGMFPDNYSAIRSLKGVGDYTAAAISSFAFGLPYPVMDGNVIRVIARYFGIVAYCDKAEGKSQIKKALNAVFDIKHPAEFNQAIMEFGALQCIPVNPSCSTCILKENCVAFEKAMVKELPVKSSKTIIKPRYFHYLIIHDGDEIIIKQRGAGDIWQGLYEFPLIETSSETTPDEVMKHPDWKYLKGKHSWNILKIQSGVRHILSHRILHVTFYEIAGKIYRLPFGAKKIKKDNLQDYAVPVLIEKYLKQN
ncbi:MAG: A/G-specific adenine glycosylase [Flavobacteriales bacterium]|nr:A/G-specific adenine glycosylase [Flavobacteriales bacterium]